MRECLPFISTTAIASLSMSTERQSLEIDNIPIEEATRIPDSVKTILPSPTIPVPSLIVLTGLPPCYDKHAVLPSVESCVVDDPVRWTDTELLQSPVPSRKWLGNLDVCLNRRLRQRQDVAV